MYNMEDTTLKNMWKDLDSKIEESRVLNMQSWALNMKCFEEMQSQKAKSKLRPLTIAKIAGLVVGILWVLFLGVLVYGNRFQNPFFTVSVAILFLFNFVAIINYVRHLVLIGQINYSDSIADTQQKLATLQSSIISNNRFLLLQFPFYCTWFISWEWIVNDPLSFWFIQVPIIILFAILGIWLYVNYSKKNLHKPWVRSLMNGSGFRSVTKAIDFMDEIDEYKKDKAI